MIIKPKDIKLFINHYKDMPSDFNLSLSAGKVDEAGDIAGGQTGAIKTFCVGMPMYSINGKMLGRLELSLYDNLDYYTGNDIEIPVESWRIKGYKGKGEKVLTYYQAKSKGLIKTNEIENDMYKKD